MTKYREYFEKMMEVNKKLFEKFGQIHQNYTLNQDKFQEEFNKEGEKVLAVIHEWENKLCSQSEKGGYGVFTGNLTEKFQAEVKKEFPLIDHVGIIVSKTPSIKSGFSLKKINLT
jgi:hypothetical protein